MATKSDVIIIGGGPAGLSAGLYAARAGLATVCIESIAPGGQLAKTNVIENYPGFPGGIEGWKLAYDMQQQAQSYGMTVANDEVEALEITATEKTVRAKSGNEYIAPAVIVASGARPRFLGVPGENEYQGKGVSYCATCDGNFFKDKDVVVVGGGNTAAGDALYLSRLCRKVYLVHRRDSLRATKVYHSHLTAADNIEVVWNSTVDAILGNDDGVVRAIELSHTQNGEKKTLECSGVFIAVGLIPNTDFLYGSVNLDDGGYVIADDRCETAIPGLYAAGDVRAKYLRQVVTAVADGALAAEGAAEFLAI